MSEGLQKKSEQKAIDLIKANRSRIQPKALAQLLLEGDRNALSQAITLVESTHPSHQDAAAEIIRLCLPHAGKSIRIGITGVPGVGKSSFIEEFGTYVIEQGKRVAVLAIDPSSPISGGSILGDKTRMDQLAANEKAFIRPSPSSQTLGGVARKTRETILLCEAAGYDAIFVETVGVGQSETTVHGMTDFFLLLMLAGAGDQLQGIKRGIMEMCDAMLITKADGDNAPKAQRAKSEYFSALHLFPAKSSGWTPRVDVVSSLEKRGMDLAWKMVTDYETWMKERNLFEANRQAQDLHWMHETIKEELIAQFYSSPENAQRIADVEGAVRQNLQSPFEGAKQLLSSNKT
jgi:LAO/AO transport system kinase